MAKQLRNVIEVYPVQHHPTDVHSLKDQHAVAMVQEYEWRGWGGNGQNVGCSGRQGFTKPSNAVRSAAKFGPRSITRIVVKDPAKAKDVHYVIEYELGRYKAVKAFMQ